MDKIKYIKLMRLPKAARILVTAYDSCDSFYHLGVLFKISNDKILFEEVHGTLFCDKNLIWNEVMMNRPTYSPIQPYILGYMEKYFGQKYVSVHILHFEYKNRTTEVLKAYRERK